MNMKFNNKLTFKPDNQIAKYLFVINLKSLRMIKISYKN